MADHWMDVESGKGPGQGDCIEPGTGNSIEPVGGNSVEPGAGNVKKPGCGEDLEQGCGVEPDSDSGISERALRWVVRAVDAKASVESVRRLYGGMSAIVHGITLASDQGRREVVLRQVDNAEWLSEEPDLARHEAAALQMAERTGLPVPRLLAFDETGAECGMPAVLMTMLPGQVVLVPADLSEWLDGQAAALAQIHAAAVTEEDAASFPWRYFTYNRNLDELQPPPGTSDPERWEAAFAVVRGPWPETRTCFIHRDYHPTNVLWQEGRLSGVVDWVNACLGPAGVDVGHCRINLVQLYGVEAADEFLAAYRRYAGAAFRYEPYWDLMSLADVLSDPPSVYPGWAEFGMTDLTYELMVERMDAYVASLLGRVSGSSGPDPLR